MKTYLTGQHLWEIVEGTEEPPNARNDRVIGKISSGKIAWDTLAEICALTETVLKLLEDDTNNYLDWNLQVKAILTKRQLWEIVEGTDDPPKAEKNDMALELIRISCELSFGDKIKNITSAKIVWNTFAGICALRRDIFKDYHSIEAFIERLDSIVAVIKRLDDVDNYLDWSDRVKAYLMDQQLWDIVKGTDEPPKAETDEAAFKAWSEKNAMAFGVIVFSCGYRLRFAIWWITSAKIAWDTLAEICKFPKSSYIVPEEYGYVVWSDLMKTYLKDCDLWDIVEAATEPTDDKSAFDAWSKKNAIALYLIWESSDAFFSFKKSTRTAQIAWDTLAEFHSSEVSAEEPNFKRPDPLHNLNYYKGSYDFKNKHCWAVSYIAS